MNELLYYYELLLIQINSKDQVMDIVNIEASTFERMLEKVQALCSIIENTAEILHFRP